MENGKHFIVYTDKLKVDGHLHSITRLFECAASLNSSSCAYLLSGMGKDGATGPKKIKSER